MGPTTDLAVRRYYRERHVQRLRLDPSRAWRKGRRHPNVEMAAAAADIPLLGQAIAASWADGEIVSSAEARAVMRWVQRRMRRIGNAAIPATATLRTIPDDQWTHDEWQAFHRMPQRVPVMLIWDSWAPEYRATMPGPDREQLELTYQPGGLLMTQLVTDPGI